MTYGPLTSTTRPNTSMAQSGIPNERTTIINMTSERTSTPSP
jgi:hypothetical protein